ncbi:glycosyltransferase, partial [Micromonospora sp. NPDC023633]
MPAPAPSFAHLARLSDDTGLFEHARHAIVRREHGYCTDDVARGLLVASREPEPSAQVLGLAERYLAFLTHAQDGRGAFHNRLGHDRRWADQPGLGDWWGRALWGLGTAAARNPAAWIRTEALVAFSRGAARRSAAPHAMAFAGLWVARASCSRTPTRPSPS